ncbi:hypothetical protein ACLBWZ_16255 [Brucellaceae bacterium C25G]
MKDLLSYRLFIFFLMGIVLGERHLVLGNLFAVSGLVMEILKRREAVHKKADRFIYGSVNLKYATLSHFNFQLSIGFIVGWMVGVTGIEPVTPTMSMCPFTVFSSFHIFLLVLFHKHYQ